MAIIAINSFYFDAQGWILGNTSRTVGAGQNGIAAIRATLGADAGATLGFSAGVSEYILGFCHRVTVLGAGRILQLLDGSGNVIAGLSITAAGELIAFRNAQVELGRSLPGVVAASVELYIEIRHKCSTTVGEIEVRVNGDPTPIINLTGVNSGGTSVGQIQFYSVGGQGTRDHSAFYLLDKTGSAPHNNFLGHVRFAVLNPTGNGNSSQLVGSDGNSTDNYLLVDDATAQDGDTTYVQSSTVNEKDTYAMGDMPTAPLTVFTVTPVIHARKTDAGTRAIKAVVRRSGTDYDGATDRYLGNSYVAYREHFLTDPSTAAAWTEAGINAMEVGVKVSV